MGGAASDQLASMCEQFISRTLPEVVQKLTAHIDERFAVLENRRRPRPGPYAIADVANAPPLSIPSFLHQKEQLDPAFARVRKNFAAGFSILVSILKQDALEQQGRPPSHDNRNMYTEADRHVMEHAWETATAYREFLLGRPIAPAGSDARPSVVDLLQRSARD